MIDWCLRCQKEAAPGSGQAGDFYLLRRPEESQSRHYRLCPACAERYILRLDGDGGVRVALRSPQLSPPPFPSRACLQLVFRIGDRHPGDSTGALVACTGRE